MALNKCKECGNQVSSKAKTCPNCGAPVSSGSNAAAGCLTVIAIAIVFGYCSSLFDSDKPSTATKPQPPKTAAEIRTERIQKAFSAWDGSHRGLEKLIKKTMNDPDSYKHVETRYSDNGDHLVVKTTFRGKNAFGGTVTNWVMAKIDLDGNVLEILAQGP